MIIINFLKPRIPCGIIAKYLNCSLEVSFNSSQAIMFTFGIIILRKA